MHTLFFELGAILLVATALGYAAHRLHQPVFVAYLLTGILVSAFGFGQAINPESLALFADLGIAFLLFLVGIELHLTDLRRLGWRTVAIALGQIALTFLAGFAVASAFGLGASTALFLALAITFSSTIIVVKLLNDRREGATLHGRLAFGFMLVQDIVALLALMLIATLGTLPADGGGLLGVVQILLIAAKAGTMLVGAYAGSRYLLPPVFRRLAGSKELLFLGSIAWCVIGAAGAQALGFSLEVGSLLAGLSLASSSYQFQISAQIRPLRDFFIAVFFIVLGLGLTLGSLGTVLLPALALAAVVIIINPLAIILLMSLAGYKKHTTFFTAILTGQVGEFSLKIIALGATLGSVSGDMLSLITLVVLLSIVASGYILQHRHALYRHARPLLVRLERHRARAPSLERKRHRAGHVVLIGCHRLGYDFLHALRAQGVEVLVIDYDPDVVAELVRRDIPVLYGDGTDDEILREADIDTAAMVVSTVADHGDTLLLLRHREDLPARAAGAFWMVTAGTVEEAMLYYRLGADYVIVPALLSGKTVVTLIEGHWGDPAFFARERVGHLEDLAAHSFINRS